ncbi:hypothetical protein [Streptomyces sp. GESEQ-4]|uniref:hypothetical protein n=1 Tax=Streptomyces sp. GESEQ-4 TaxID=2812655 RepID=UPI001FF09EE0|nr:hypothetical protein [Streptomyces sp. GESEQ-4]
MDTPSRRTVLRSALGLGAGAALAACGTGSTTARTSGDVTLALWTHDPGYEAFFTKGITDADRLTDFRYRLEVTRAGAPDLVTKLLAQAVAGRGTPDLAGFEIGSFPRMLRGDIAPRLLQRERVRHLPPCRAAPAAGLPAVALFVLLRKQLLEGLSTGAVKG